MDVKTFTLNIGQIATHVGAARYQCFGLGSCVGLFLCDRLSGITGAAHILLPDAEPGPDRLGWYSADLAISELIRRFEMQGSDLSALSAKFVGGANTLSTTRTGGRNVASVVEHLRKRNIFIAGSAVGGTKSRTVRYDAPTGSVTVRTQGEKTETTL